MLLFSLGGLLLDSIRAISEPKIVGLFRTSAHGFTIAIASIRYNHRAFVCSKPEQKHGRLKALKIIAFSTLFLQWAVSSAI